jgi:arginine exporter protein ArgO
MYSVGVFLFIAVIDVFMTWYGVVEKGSDYYKDLIALFLATFLSLYLAICSVSGTVLLTSAPTYLQDDGLMWIGILIAVAQGFVLLLEIVEAVQDYKEQKKSRLLRL